MAESASLILVHIVSRKANDGDGPSSLVVLMPSRCDLAMNEYGSRYRSKQKTALLPAPFWCTYAWNRPTSTGAGGSDPLWLGWRGTP
jgi:hypothetical protein